MPRGTRSSSRGVRCSSRSCRQRSRETVGTIGRRRRGPYGTEGVGMSRTGRAAGTVAAIVLATLVASAGVAPMARAQTTPDRSEVVLVFDFSASILQDATNRNRFGAALEGIAARVDATSADLIAGDATVTLVRFATKAADQPGCADLKLLNSPAAVTKFATCLRTVATAYRKGLDPALTRTIAIDTNYVAAMEQAARHLPAASVRPAMIRFP